MLDDSIKSMPRAVATAFAFTSVTASDRMVWNESRQGGVENQRMLAGGELAVIADAQRLNPRFAHLPNQAAELFRERRVRLQLLELLRRHGREVDGVANDAGLQEVAQRRRRLDADQFLAFLVDAAMCGLATTCGSCCSV